MCGIAGVITSGPAEKVRGIVERMVRACRHRGPDAERTVVLPLPDLRHLGLGHARLRILDLSEASAQPMEDPASGSWLVYNGEIYNYRALRDQLARAGEPFRSTGDTEVVLRALLRWGEAALPKLSGMYAFAFWDGATQQLSLARDPFGIKPLFLGRAGDDLVFGSEIRALRDAAVVPTTLSRAAIESVLAYGAVVEPATIATEVIAIPPGHVVTVDGAGRVRPPRRVWALRDILGAAGGEMVRDPDAAVWMIGAELERSVIAHLESDVPVGVFLSGGIDSSLIASMIDRAGRREDVTLLTVGFPEHEFSEIDYARAVAGRVAGTHTIIRLDSAELRRLLPMALAAMDQPTVDGVNTFVVSRVAADLGLRVALSGLGGDEVFGGYTTFWKAPWLARHARAARWLARIWPVGAGIDAGQLHKVAQADNVFSLRDAYLLHRAIRWRDATSFLEGLRVPPDDFAMPSETSESLDNWKGLDDVHHVAFLEMSFYMRNQLLRDGDVFSSANAVELRVPFLDPGVVAAAWALPAAHHVSGRRGKLVTSELLRRLYPHASVERQKMGFVLPWKHWLAGGLHDLVTDVLGSARLYHRVGLDPRSGAAALDAFRRGDPLVSWLQVWSLFVLLQWVDRHGL